MYFYHDMFFLSCFVSYQNLNSITSIQVFINILTEVSRGSSDKKVIKADIVYRKMHHKTTVYSFYLLWLFGFLFKIETEFRWKKNQFAKICTWRYEQNSKFQYKLSHSFKWRIWILISFCFLGIQPAFCIIPALSKKSLDSAFAKHSFCLIIKSGKLSPLSRLGLFLPE